MARIERLSGALETWRLTDGASMVEVAPSRGGLVTSFVVDGVPVLFMDQATLLDPSKNVRGGVPLLFPFAGKPPPGSSLGQHGFARKLPWIAGSSRAESRGDTARLECKLSSSEQTLAAWPFSFSAQLAVSLFDSRLMLEWAFQNLGTAPMPLHFGIHPYFCVGAKEQVKVEGASGPAFDNKLGSEREVDRVDFAQGEVDLHFTPFELGGTTLHRGDGRKVKLAWTEQFKTLVVWTLPGQAFVGVEQWTSPGLSPARLHVAPGMTERLAVAMSLET